ncbi:hypothetical protein F5X98DRAFT_377545 [Xylaria grammica]|nr:hypothetical protein F5X98DRAFT_377545 [Xylaria grammica]
MTLAAPAIIGIVGLFLTSIPGIRYIWRKIRHKLRSRGKKQSTSGTILPMSDHSSPNFHRAGVRSLSAHAATAVPLDTLTINHQMMLGEEQGDHTITGRQGFVAVSMSAAVVWSAVDYGSQRGDIPMSRTVYHHD